MHLLVVETANLFDEHGPLAASGVRYAFLHDVRREFVLRQRQHLTADRAYQFGFVLLFTVFYGINV